MFTGLIAEIGQLKKTQTNSYGQQLTFETSHHFGSTLKLGDSIAVNGACLTVCSFQPTSFMVEVSRTSLHKTTLGALTINHKVNLEKALRAHDRLDGHLVQGHVTETTQVLRILPQGSGHFLVTFQLPSHLRSYVVKEGSVAIDGTSLTVAKIHDHHFEVAIIGHTWHNTISQYYRPQTKVNLEVDIVGKYVVEQLRKGTRRPHVILG